MGKGKDLSVFTPAVVELVFERDKGRCAKCGRQWDQHSRRGELGGWDMQHRMARGAGGSRKNPAVGNVSNGIILCRTCHNEVESRTVDSWAEGFAMSRLGIQQPWQKPIKHAVHGWVRLTQKGGFERCNPPDD